LLELFGIAHLEQYQRIHKGWIEDALKAEDNQRMFTWTQSLAVGSQDYVSKVKSALGLAGGHRTVVVDDDVHTLKETATSHMLHLRHKKTGFKR
jgi:putative transposase